MDTTRHKTELCYSEVALIHLHGDQGIMTSRRENAVTESILFSRPDQKYKMMATSSALLEHLQRGGAQVFPRLEFSRITQQKTLPFSPAV